MYLIIKIICDTLRVVLRYLDLKLNGEQIDKLANADPLAVEWILFEVKSRVEQLIREGRFRPSNRRSRSAANSNGTFHFQMICYVNHT